MKKTNLLLFSIFFILACGTSIFAKTLTQDQLPRIHPANLKAKPPSNDSSEPYPLEFGGSYEEPLDSTNSNHTGRGLKNDGCGLNAIKITVTRFQLFRRPQGCTSYDPSLDIFERCSCTWMRYGFTNQCYSDCYAARWRNCDLEYEAADISPFIYKAGQQNSWKLHRCCPFNTFFKKNPQWRNHGYYKVCRMNVAPYGSKGTQIKKRYTVFFWFCTPNGPHILSPVLYYFRNGVKYRTDPPYDRGILNPPRSWLVDNWVNTKFIPPPRERDQPGFPFPPPVRRYIDPPDYFGPASAEDDSNLSAYPEDGVDYEV